MTKSKYWYVCWWQSDKDGNRRHMSLEVECDNGVTIAQVFFGIEKDQEEMGMIAHYISSFPMSKADYYRDKDSREST